MKVCRLCGVEKPLSDFFIRSDSGKPRGECRVCERSYKKNWDSKNKDRKSSYTRKWAEKNPANYRASSRRASTRYRAAHLDECRDLTRTWQKANPEKVAAATRNWLARNPGWELRYREENREQLKLKNRQWQLANPARVREKARRYQASRQHATPAWLSAIQLAQIQEFYEIAEALEMQTDVRYHVDHIHALNGKNFRGLHVPWNLQVLPYDENIRKSNQLPVEYV